MYSRDIGGKEYTFGVSGKLIMNTLVMYDRETGSLWAQLLGEAVGGPLKGAKLEYVSGLHTTWADWKAQHPDTLALVKGYRGSSSSYTGYYRSPDAGVIGESYTDNRLYVKEFVIGVELNGDAVAYPYSALNKQPVVNDTLGGEPVLIVFNAETGAGAVFKRATGKGQTLTMSQQTAATLADAETGSTWDSFTGVAVAGPLAGTQLTPIKNTSAFWFGWKDWYPHTRIFGQ